MDGETRRVLENAYRQDDEARAAYDRHESQREREQLKKRSSDDFGLVYKTTYTPTARPVQQANVLDPVAQEAWNRWCDQRILKLFKPGALLGNVISETISLVRAEWRKEIAAEAEKLREEISGLRIDEVVGRSVLRGEINELREAGVKKKART